MEEAEIWHDWNFKCHCCISHDGVSCHFSPSHLFACCSFNNSKNLSYHAPNLKSTVEKNLSCSRSGFTNHQPAITAKPENHARWYSTLDEVGKQASYWPATGKGGTTQASAPEHELRDSYGKCTMFNQWQLKDFKLSPKRSRYCVLYVPQGSRARTALNPPQAAHGLDSIS